MSQSWNPHHAYARDILKQIMEASQANYQYQLPIVHLAEGFELCEAILSGKKKFNEVQSEIEEYCFTNWSKNQLIKLITNGTNQDQRSFLKILKLNCLKRIAKEPECILFDKKLNL